jgi:aminomethyltransferase
VDLGALGYFRFSPEPVELAGALGFLSRTGFTGEVGYEFFLLEGDAERVWDATLEAGARPFGLDAVEMMRIEQGLVISEEDYFPGKTDPFDLSLDAFIDLGGEFIGKAVAAATAAAPPHRFKTLAIAGDEIPEHGATVVKDGGFVGEVTSADRSPRFGVLALAVLRAEVAQVGEVLEVGGRPAVVGRLPFDAEGRARSDPRHPLRIA